MVNERPGRRSQVEACFHFILLIRTLRSLPSVSVLERFDCIRAKFYALFIRSSFIFSPYFTATPLFAACRIAAIFWPKACVDTLEILGVFLDNKLTFQAYVKEQLNKACAKASALRKIRKFISKDVLVRLYKAYVLPHLEYCSPLLLGVGNAETTKIETINYFILRTILGYSKSVSYDFLLKMADIKSLEKRRQFQSLVMLYTVDLNVLKSVSINKTLRLAMI